MRLGVIQFREFEPDDFLPLRVLDQAFKHVYIADDAELLPVDYGVHFPGWECDHNHDCVNHQSRSKTLVFTAPTANGREIIGYANFTGLNVIGNTEPPVLHFTMRPAYLKTFLKEKAYLPSLEDRFRALGVDVIRIVSPAFDRTARRIIEKMGFKPVSVEPASFLKHGKHWDVVTFELTHAAVLQAMQAHRIAEEKRLGTGVVSITQLPQARKAAP